MKRKVLSALLASAFVGVATTASAGVIQASYKNYAAEVFGDNTVTLTAPTINYSLATPLSGTAANPNSFSVAWTLDNGAWAAAPANNAIALNTPDNNAANLLNPVSVSLSADKKTLTANFVLNNGINYTTQSQITLGTTAGGSPQLNKIGTILGAPALNTNGCTSNIATINVTIALTNAAGAPFDINIPNAPQQMTTPLAQSSVAIKLTAANSASFSSTVPANNELGKVNVLTPVLGTAFTNGDGATVPNADVTGNSTTILNIGSIKASDYAAGGLYDLSGSAAYSVNTAAFGTNPNTSVGVVETNGLTLNLTGQFLTAAGTSVYASAAANCAAAGAFGTGTIAADGKSAVLTLAAGAEVQHLAAGVPVYLCYSLPAANTASIPLSQFAIASGSLTKYTTALELPNPVCPAPIYNLVSNGVRVDVRNYVPGIAKAPSGGWYSVIRVINTDDVQTVVPVAQALLANGTLGASATMDNIASVDNKTGALAPREVRYYFSYVIDAALNAAATAAKPTFGQADIGGNARLRITAPSSSIRVQNYVYNAGNGQFFEASAAQGDDGPDYARAADATNK